VSEIAVAIGLVLAIALVAYTFKPQGTR